MCFPGLLLLLLLCCCDKDHWQKNLGDLRVYLAYTSTSQSQFIIEGSQGRNSRRETMEEDSLRPCSPCLSQPGFLYHPGSLSRDGTTSSGLCPPTSITNQENPHRHTYRQYGGDIFCSLCQVPKYVAVSVPTC